jgi:hypothetical protein
VRSTKVALTRSGGSIARITGLSSVRVDIEVAEWMKQEREQEQSGRSLLALYSSILYSL